MARTTNAAAPLRWTVHIWVDEPQVKVRSATRVYSVWPSSFRQTIAWSDKLVMMNVANLHHIKQQKLNRSFQNVKRRDAHAELVHSVHQRDMRT